MKETIDKFSNLKGSQFISIKGYTNSEGEVSNYLLNVNFDYLKMLRNDLRKLNGFHIENITGYSKGDIKVAYEQLLSSYESKVKREETNRSVAQLDAYVQIGGGLKLHKSTLSLHVIGICISKRVVSRGAVDRAVRKKNKITVIKELIERKAGLSSPNLKQFKINNADTVKVHGTTLHIHS